jgi:hypothetical protein
MTDSSLTRQVLHKERAVAQFPHYDASSDPVLKRLEAQFDERELRMAHSLDTALARFERRMSNIILAGLALEAVLLKLI